MSVPIIAADADKAEACKIMRDMIDAEGYQLVEINEDKPWGAYYRFVKEDAKRFVEQFFPGLSYEEACLGDPTIELSPKFLLFLPHQRLSWQYHHRRAERWRFLTGGTYNRSLTDEPGETHQAQIGESVQFEAGERHRFQAGDEYAIVAEIWQHVDSARLSDEEDIVRLVDDYQRP